MRLTQIQKLYISNFLSGLVFWYGIEKLFMRSIGIDAVGVGIATAVFLVFDLIFDIPAGIIADKWSRKGMLIISVVSLAICSVIFGTSHGLLIYAIGEVFYGLYIVANNGTYQAIVYDSLNEQNQAHQYSKIMGRADAIFLVGAGLANMASGFIAGHFNFRLTFYITVVSCLVNVILMVSIHEPTLHKSEQKERIFTQLKAASLAISKIKLLRSLTVVMSGLAVIDLFSSEFGQLYMLRYLSTPQLLGVLWALYAFSWALGSLIAHRLRARLHTLVLGAAVPLIIMSFVNNWFNLVLFMTQVIAAGALYIQIETRVQENTPSPVRASVLSVFTSISGAISIPASFVIGWLVRRYDVFWALRFVAIIAAVTLIYWLWSQRTIPKADEPIIAQAN